MSIGASLDDQKTKELFKQAMIELLEERQDLFYDLFAEVIEDSLFVRAIREGESTDAYRNSLFSFDERSGTKIPAMV